MKPDHPLSRLRHHITGAIERGESQPIEEQAPMSKFKTNYDYENPGRAGPFKGSMPTERQYKKGETIHAPFGRAIVRSSRLSNPQPSPWRQ